MILCRNIFSLKNNLMLNAITRAISPNMDNCELTHFEREPINIQQAIQQHKEYENNKSKSRKELIDICTRGTDNMHERRMKGMQWISQRATMI